METKYSILIPAYNAEPMLGEVLDQVLPLGYPVGVINDGSVDRTGEVAASRKIAFLETHEHNKGKGAALKSGFRVASERGFTHVLTLDADGQHPAESIETFVESSIEKPDSILVGNRFGDETIDSMPRVRRMSNGVSSSLISLAAQHKIPDAQCGMRVYPLRILEQFSLISDGYAMETEVLVKAGRRGVEVVNIPIACHYPQGTTTSGYRAIADSWKIAKIVFWSLREGK
ncbi:MAG: glycosyltransferase family 2 protein [Candidatus Omnitrophica bacterium]|nr:glycosyltransferase family 2 protein [Candidatus Omnitrophota bacterium]MCA9447325.1 glycosyltransferase family 2 protein [Candidatus Omnitrophota bacterium]